MHTDGIADDHAQDDGHDEIAQVEGLHEGMQGDEARRYEPRKNGDACQQKDTGQGGKAFPDK